MPAYYVDLPQRAHPLRWDPHAGPLAQRADTRYFGAALVAMEAQLADPDVVVYLTWNARRLPSYGDRVVAILLGDEAAQIPRYVDRVRAVFKCYGTRPTVGALRPDLLGLAAVAQWGLRWIRWLPGGTADGRRRLRATVRGEPRRPAPFPIPVGTYNQIELPLRPIAQRPTDVFFAGSISHDGRRRETVSPKQLARTQMLDAVTWLQRGRPGLRVEIRSTDGFEASADAPADAYSRALMDSRICLAPRGTSLETFRVLEGLRYGCAVVAESLPRSRYYDGAPVLRVRRWDQLTRVLSPLLDDPVALEQQHRRALEWWRDRCSEACVGRYLAHALNSLGPVDALG